VADFVGLPIDKLLNRRNPITRIELLENKNGARPSSTVIQLGQISANTGNLIVDGSLQVVNPTTGTPDVTINQYGVSFTNQEGFIQFLDTTGAPEILQMYTDADNCIVIKNSFGGKGVSFLIDDALHNVEQIDFTADGIDLASGGQYMVGGLPAFVAETQADDIFRVDSPGGPSLFVATINGAPVGTSVTYNAPSSGTEAAIVPFSASQLAKLRLYNTTRGNSALISNVNTATNVITLAATVPVNWASGDTITIASQTVSGGGSNWVDLEITSGVTGKTSIFANLFIVSATVGHILRVHPLDTYAAASETNITTQAVNQTMSSLSLIKVTSNVFSIAWTGTPLAVVIREAGFLQ
jgi:hypothetical protein